MIFFNVLHKPEANKRGIVVSGGYNNGIYIADTWTHMPNMVDRRANNKSVAIKNKLFILGFSYEVYDSFCNKFVLFKSPSDCFNNAPYYPRGVISIEGKIVVLYAYHNYVYFYDVESNTWSREVFEVTGNNARFCCCKMPQM